MGFITTFMLFLTVIFAVLSFYSIAFNKNRSITRRLTKIKRSNNILEAHDELNLPLYTRIIKPIVDQINKSITNIMPSEIRVKIEKELIQAGNPFGLDVDKWVTFRLALLVGLPLFTVTVALMGHADLRRVFVILLVEIGLAFLMPRIILKQKVTDRKDEIERTLPDVLDLLTVSVEAGLGFDAALSRVTDKIPGQLSNEFRKVLQEIKVGTPRKEALKNMTERVQVPDLLTFIGSIIQAEQLGVSIGNVLRIQSAQMRQKRRQKAQEKAMKAPVKMLFPMVFFIFPTIFAVLLGPVVIRLMDNFAK